MSITSFSKNLSRSNLGLGKMHDSYITVPTKIDPAHFFGNPPKTVKIFDKKLNRNFEFPFTYVPNGEYRLTKFKEYFNIYDAKPGDSIMIERESNNNSFNYYIEFKNNTSEDINAKVIYAFLKQGLSHRKIQEEILKKDAPSNGGGFAAMTILHSYDIKDDKKGVLVKESFNDEYSKSEGKYKDALDLLLNFYPEFSITKNTLKMNKFDYKAFYNDANGAGLIFSEEIISRFAASLCTKPFVILSGLSGSGKTKIAQSFVQWICEDDTQYRIIPVGADWTNREPLVGYPNGLVSDEYITPDSGVIHLIMDALKKGNENRPFFLILDEMNLSHVERYFADFLSIMESNDSIKLYTGKERLSLDGIQIPLEIGWPKNVFIIGTVNIDETTYMFSPKVLDRANVIEFRITEEEINGFLASPGIPDLQKLKGQGIAMAESFLSIAAKTDIVKNEAITNELVAFFSQLQNVGAEFGYRSATEIMQLVSKLKQLEPNIKDNECLDIAVMQKLLPKLHGSRSKLVKILIALAGLCIDGIKKEDFEKNFEELYKKDFEGINVKYSISFEKLIRMYKNVLANGFTSYAEA